MTLSKNFLARLNIILKNFKANKIKITAFNYNYREDKLTLILNTDLKSLSLMNYGPFDSNQLIEIKKIISLAYKESIFSSKYFKEVKKTDA